jgi:hypothetical protein
MPETGPMKACWTPERVATVVTTIAKMDASRSHYFLASHSPITGILDERLQRPLDEESLFKAVFDRSRAETLAVIWGEPGSGKSHLIHWLKLRTEYALKHGELDTMLPVLVQRRSGNLKDALQQLVEQLPPEFQKYMDPVRKALDRINADTAREMLANALSIELLPQTRQERGLAPLDRRLGKVRELCLSPGTRGWLCRPDGVIDREVRRLTGTERQGGEPREARFEFSEFTAITPQHLRGNSAAAMEVVDEIEFEPELAHQVAAAFNDALPFAVGGLTGLGGTTLREVFDAIRSDLKASKRWLALFIEDVSVMSDLDSDVLRAVEPQSNPKLCRLVAVLGMTDGGKNRLRDNELGRIHLLVQMRRSVEEWRDSEEAVAQFAARYLNAVRLREDDVRKLAAHRRTGGDVNRSACDGCQVREGCFPAFGSVELEGVQIGLFPFTRPAPRKLLVALDTSKGGIRQNQRGFLDQVLRPAVQELEQFEERSFPDPTSFSVRLDEPLHWAPFTARNCVNWSIEDKDRLRFLAQAWIEGRSEQDYASLLTPLLAPLGFEPFTGGQVAPRRVQPPQPQLRPDKEPPKPETPEPPKDGLKKAGNIQNALADWIARPDGVLEHDGPIRDLLLKFVKSCLPVENEWGLPVREFKRLLGNKKSSVYVEGQRSQPAAVVFELKFERSEETRALIEALAYFEHVGSASWSFKSGEHYKRVVSRWLRRNGRAFLQRLEPAGLDRERPVRAAIAVLCLAAAVRRRKALPKSRTEALDEIFTPFEVDPVLLKPGTDWERRLKTLRTSHEELRQFVLAELDVPQGMTSDATNFVDPRPVLEAIPAFADTWQVPDLPQDYSTSHWKARYEPARLCEYFVDLPALLATEREELKRHLEMIRRVVDTPSSGAPQAVRKYLKEMGELVRTLREQKLVLPDDAFEAVKPRLAEAAESAGEVEAAITADSSTGVEPILTFAPEPFSSLAAVLGTCQQFVERVEVEVDRTEKRLTAEGDPDALQKSLLARLDALAAGPAEEGER